MKRSRIEVSFVQYHWPLFYVESRYREKTLGNVGRQWKEIVKHERDCLGLYKHPTFPRNLMSVSKEGSRITAWQISFNFYSSVARASISWHVSFCRIPLRKVGWGGGGSQGWIGQLSNISHESNSSKYGIRKRIHCEILIFQCTVIPLNLTTIIIIVYSDYTDSQHRLTVRVRLWSVTCCLYWNNHSSSDHGDHSHEKVLYSL